MTKVDISLLCRATSMLFFVTDYNNNQTHDSYWQHQPESNFARFRFIVNIKKNDLVTFYRIRMKRSNRIGSDKSIGERKSETLDFS